MAKNTKIIALIPTRGDNVTKSVNSCLEHGLDILVVCHNCTVPIISENIKINSIEVSGGNLAHALNAGLEWIYENKKYTHIMRLDATSSTYCAPKIHNNDKEKVIVALRRNTLFKIFQKIPIQFLIVFDNPFSHSGLIIPVKKKIFYNEEYRRSQDLKLYLDHFNSLSLGRNYTFRSGINENSASFSDRIGQLEYSIKAFGESNSLPKALNIFCIFTRKIKLWIKRQLH